MHGQKTKIKRLINTLYTTPHIT